ncbi:MAG: metal-dependent transcriptional regulator [Candidatus Latescibacterota bacterium]|nr:MAG: metal-dependent transcriptional regulator [Candidatus Latescibacterota bacterium]
MGALTEGLEDYLEAVLLEEKDRRFVRTKDLAKRLGVTSPSVSAAVKALATAGLVNHESYGHIELTPKGRKRAQLVYSRHRTLYRLFAKTLGLPARISETNACAMEHRLDAGAVRKLMRLLEFLERKAGASDAFAAELEKALGDD